MNKLLAPVIFALLFIALAILYFSVIMQIPMSGWIKGVLALGLLAIVASMGYVLYRRIKEIEKEDPDDLSKY